MENIRVGGVYKNGSGNIVMIYYEDLADPVFKFDGYLPELNSTNSYTKRGGHYAKVTHAEFDLIEEVYYSLDLADILGNPMNIESLKNIYEKMVLSCL